MNSDLDFKAAVKAESINKMSEERNASCCTLGADGEQTLNGYVVDV